MNIPYEEFGGEGPELYFFHANGFPPSCYSPLIDFLTPYYQVVAMKARPIWPHSPPTPRGIFSWETFVDDTIHFLEHRRAKKVWAMGHSMGGIQILLAAAKRPDLFGGLILLDPVLFSPLFTHLWWWCKEMGLARINPFIELSRNRKTHFTSREAIFQNYRSKKAFQFFSDSSLHAYIRGMTREIGPGQFELIYPPAWEAWVYGHDPQNTWHNLRSLPFPILLLRGEKSYAFWPVAVRAFLRRFPHTIHKDIPKSNHLLPLEAPERVAKEVKSFLLPQKSVTRN